MLFNIMLFSIGTCLGSYISLCGYRISKGESIIFPNSYCDNCNYPLNYFQILPIISQYKLFNECSKCKFKNPKKYTLIEIIFGWSLIFFIHNCNNIFNINCNLDFIINTLFISSLLLLSIIDINTYKIPSRFLYLLIFSGLIINCFKYNYIDINIIFEKLLISLIAFLILELFSKSYHLIRNKIPFGTGDSKIISLFIIWIGLKGAIFSLFISLYLALIFIIFYFLIKKDIKERIPFIPFLSCGAYLYILF